MPRGEHRPDGSGRVDRQAFMMTGADMEYYQNRANAGQDEDGPLCSNCTDDMGEALEWHDRGSIYPSNRVPCVGCGAV